MCIHRKMFKLFQLHPKKDNATRPFEAYMSNSTLFHFAWWFKPDDCPPDSPMVPACDQWKQVRQRLPWGAEEDT